MREWIEVQPEVDVPTAAYQRLLGHPPGYPLEGRSRELADWARAWYASHGRPWVYAREMEVAPTDGTSVDIGGETFHSEALSRRFERAAVHRAVLAAVSAGPEIEREAQKLWREEKPDEYYFLEVLGSVVTEQLTATLGERLCSWAEARGTAVLQHYSPGYPGWDIAEQSRLLGLLKGGGEFPGGLEALESGALRPKKSQLAVFGVTQNTDNVQRLTDMVACESCSLPACQYRRQRRGS